MISDHDTPPQSSEYMGIWGMLSMQAQIMRSETLFPELTFFAFL